MYLALPSLLVLLACQALAEPDPDILSRLREGGYVLYLRHTSTDFSQNDSRMTSFEDCTTQRNLTEKGRAEARALGEHVKRLKIPIGEVLTSPTYRARETARHLRIATNAPPNGGSLRNESDRERNFHSSPYLFPPVALRDWHNLARRRSARIRKSTNSRKMAFAGTGRTTSCE